MRYLGLFLVAACGEVGVDNPDSDGEDSDLAEPDPALIAELQAALDAAVVGQPSGVRGMGLWVRDRDGRDWVKIEAGEFDWDTRIPIASATKMVSALVLLRLVDQGDLGLADTTGQVLGWEGSGGSITLDQLGGFTSGLEPDAPCTFLPNLTLEECVAAIERLDTLGAPGSRFDYGGTHLHVAGGMAEERLGEDWNTIAAEVLYRPLGLNDPGLTVFTLPKQAKGLTNPLVAGGMWAKPTEYTAFLDLILQEGRHGGQPLIRADLIERMYQNKYTGALEGGTPLADTPFDFRYGFGSWLECEGAVPSCPVISSPGSFGFTPWVDRETGYWGLLAMEGDPGTATAHAVYVEQDIRPTVEALVRGTR